jgi:hypothetical protein
MEASMAFSGWSDDGEATFDSKEAAIERAKMMREWECEPTARVMVQRFKWLPLWIIHLLQGTWLEKIAYYEVKE